jgi:hypothetical protein
LVSFPPNTQDISALVFSLTAADCKNTQAIQPLWLKLCNNAKNNALSELTAPARRQDPNMEKPRKFKRILRDFLTSKNWFLEINKIF